MTLHVRHSGVWKGAGPFVRHEGVWKVPAVTYARNAGGWRFVAQALKSATAAPASQGAFFGHTAQISVLPAGDIAGQPVGYGLLSYTWRVVSGPGTIVAGQGGDVITVGSSQRGIATYQCVVTDPATGQQATAGATVEWT